MGPRSPRTRWRRTSTSSARSWGRMARPASRRSAGWGTGCVATEAPRDGGDAALLRRTRLRLLAWSGGLTLLILVLLGAALYAAVSGSLAAGGTGLLAARADGLAQLLERPGDGRIERCAEQHQ